MINNKIKAIISGGGSGGHVFPALAIADALKSKFTDIDILFVGAKDKIEMSKVPAAGYKIIGLWISGLQRKITIKNLLFIVKLIFSLIKSIVIIRRFKPDVVIGTGGFASGPVLNIATRMKIPTLIQEQNSYPGITNKILAHKVNRICVAFDGMDRYFPKEKIVITGNPVRKDIIQHSQFTINDPQFKEQAYKYFNLRQDKKTVLIIGGSLGAKTINNAVHSSFSFFINNSYQLIWQTGKTFYPTAIKDIKAENSLIDPLTYCQPFIDRMDYAYAIADIIVSRAGAIAISELCIIGKPVILIPSPNVAENHQYKNASILAEKNAAIIIKDSLAFNDLHLALEQLLKDEIRMKDLSDNIKKLAIFDSAELIVNEIINLLNIDNK